VLSEKWWLLIYGGVWLLVVVGLWYFLDYGGFWIRVVFWIVVVVGLR